MTFKVIKIIYIKYLTISLRQFKIIMYDATMQLQLNMGSL